MRMGDRLPRAVRDLFDSVPILKPVLPDPGVAFKLVHHDDVASALKAGVPARDAGGLVPRRARRDHDANRPTRWATTHCRCPSWRSTRPPRSSAPALPADEASWVEAARAPVLMDTAKARKELAGAAATTCSTTRCADGSPPRASTSNLAQVPVRDGRRSARGPRRRGHRRRRRCGRRDRWPARRAGRERGLVVAHVPRARAPALCRARAVGLGAALPRRRSPRRRRSSRTRRRIAVGRGDDEHLGAREIVVGKRGADVVGADAWGARTSSLMGPLCPGERRRNRR